VSTDAPPPGYWDVERALNEARAELGLDTYSDDWRAQCEARVVANMETHEIRRAYLEKVAYHRGTEAMVRLRNAAWELMREPPELSEGRQWLTE
jgi:hypothetical protein